MAIEITEEMFEAFRRTPGTGAWSTHDPEEGIRAGLAAVLAIVERDYFVEQCARHDAHGSHIWVNPGMYADRQCEGRP